MEFSRIAVLGPNGRLGRCLISLGCIPFHVRLEDSDGIRELLKLHAPDVIINCAGKTDVDGCERDIIGTYTTNTFSIENVLNLFSGMFVQLSTDYIYDGLTGPYKETDYSYNPLNSYGFSKLFAETIVKSRLPESHLIVRVTNLYDNGLHGKSNFLLWVLDQLKKKNQIKVTDQIRGNPTYVPHLASQILNAIDKGVTGVLNLGGADIHSRYEMATLVCKFFGYDLGLIQKGPFYHLARRPQNGGLILDKATKLGIQVPTFYSGLSDLHISLMGTTQ